MHPEALDKKAAKLLSLLRQFSGFYFAGGTALAIQIGHRVSIDFDLFSDVKIPQGFLDEVVRVAQGKAGEVLVNNPDELSLLIDGVKFTFLYYPFPVLRPFVEYEGARLLGIQEIAATKAYTIGRRGSLKDYVDLYFVLREGHAVLEDVIALAEKKYGTVFNGRLFLEQLVYLEDIPDTAIFFLKAPISKIDLQEFFENAVRDLKL